MHRGEATVERSTRCNERPLIQSLHGTRSANHPSDTEQHDWSEAKKAKLQALVAKLHAMWPIDRDYMAPPTRGRLVSLDPALIVTPPPGLEVGYVPIVNHQERQ